LSQFINLSVSRKSAMCQTNSSFVRPEIENVEKLINFACPKRYQ